MGNDSKWWLTSKMLWVNFFVAGFAILEAAGVIHAVPDEATLVIIVGGVIAGANWVMRAFFTDKAIAFTRN